MKISNHLIAKIKSEIAENAKLLALLDKFDKAHNEKHKALQDELSEYNEYLSSIINESNGKESHSEDANKKN